MVYRYKCRQNAYACIKFKIINNLKNGKEHFIGFYHREQRLSATLNVYEEFMAIFMAMRQNGGSIDGNLLRGNIGNKCDFS